jgi:hypothetical protein
VLTAGHWAHGNLFWGNLEATMKHHKYVSPEDCVIMFYNYVTYNMRPTLGNYFEVGVGYGIFF